MAEKEASLILRIKETGSESLKAVEKGLDKVRDLAIGLTTAFVGIAVAAFKNFRESELATNQLNQAMVNAGVFSTELRGKYEALAAALQKTTLYTDEQTVAAIAAIQAKAKGIVINDELVKATQDLAAAQGMDLASAADLVGKTIGTSTNALARYGIEINSAATTSEKMAELTKKLNLQYKGQAEAVAEGTGGFEILKNTLGEFLEDAGREISPTVIAITKNIQSMLGSMSGGNETIKAFGDVFSFVAKTLFGVKFIISEVGAAIGITLAASIEGVSLLMKGEFKKAAGIAGLAAEEFKAKTVENFTTLEQELARLDAARDVRKEEQAKQDIVRAQTSAMNMAAHNAATDETEQLAKEARMIEYQMRQNALIGANDEQVLAQRLAHLDKVIQAETNADEKLRLMKSKGALLAQQNKLMMDKQDLALSQATAQAHVNIATASANLIAAVSAKGSAAAFYASKAAALAQAIVATNLAATQALAVPPAPNFGLAALAKTAGYINIAAIAATAFNPPQLAEGGIIKARPGGMLATIGEGGRDEAVIPLENGRIPGSGGVTIIVNGGLLGDPGSAQEFAIAVDRELLKLRQSNSSVAFDYGVV
jgi:hypothetical protein